MNKYRNRKTVVNGIKFDSKAEANRYCELKILERAKQISDLELQPKFILQDSFKNQKGQTIRAITYIADFSYVENGKIVVEDVKGMETNEFKIKRKLFECKYKDVDFRIVKEWVGWEKWMK